MDGLVKGGKDDLLELINRLTSVDVYLRNKKFDAIQAKKEASKLHDELCEHNESFVSLLFEIILQ